MDFDGTQTLQVQVDDFIYGSASNDWGSAFKEFSGQIQDIIGKKMHSIFVHKFTTTTPEMLTIYEATLLSAMQKYFTYECETACGIKKVRLLGTKAAVRKGGRSGQI